MNARLNSFQRSMLQWDALHPYNAVHGVRLPRAPDADRLTRVIRSTLEAWGLTRLQLDRRRLTYGFDGGPSRVVPELLTPASNPGQQLTETIERELNRRFPAEAQFGPFRVFILPDAPGCWLGLTYFHAVSDAVSVVPLVRAVGEACLGRVGETPERSEPAPGVCEYRAGGL